MSFLPPKSTSVDEVQASLDLVKEEHRRLVDDISKAKQWLQTHAVQEKQLNDFSDFLGKEHIRIKEWEMNVSAQENKLNAMAAELSDSLSKHAENLKAAKYSEDLQMQPTHYTIKAEVGYLGANMGEPSGSL